METHPTPRVKPLLLHSLRCQRREAPARVNTAFASQEAEWWRALAVCTREPGPGAAGSSQDSGPTAKWEGPLTPALSRPPPPLRASTDPGAFQALAALRGPILVSASVSWLLCLWNGNMGRSPGEAPGENEWCQPWRVFRVAAGRWARSECTLEKLLLALLCCSPAQPRPVSLLSASHPITERPQGRVSASNVG